MCSYVLEVLPTLYGYPDDKHAIIRDFCQSILINGICSVMRFGAVLFGFLFFPVVMGDGREKIE